VAIRLLRRVRDYAKCEVMAHLSQRRRSALALLDVDGWGWTISTGVCCGRSWTSLTAGRGLDTIAASISEEADTIEDVVEPYLLQLGFLDRTPRGAWPPARL